MKPAEFIDLWLEKGTYSLSTPIRAWLSNLDPDHRAFEHLLSRVKSLVSLSQGRAFGVSLLLESLVRQASHPIDPRSREAVLSLLVLIHESGDEMSRGCVTRVEKLLADEKPGEPGGGRGKDGKDGTA